MHRTSSVVATVVIALGALATGGCADTSSAEDTRDPATQPTTTSPELPPDAQTPVTTPAEKPSAPSSSPAVCEAYRWPALCITFDFRGAVTVHGVVQATPNIEGDDAEEETPTCAKLARLARKAGELSVGFLETTMNGQHLEYSSANMLITPNNEFKPQGVLRVGEKQYMADFSKQTARLELNDDGSGKLTYRELLDHSAETGTVVGKISGTLTWICLNPPPEN